MSNAICIQVSLAKLQEHLVRPISTYKLSLLEHGHEAGYLSGANLQGKASAYSASYARSRDVLTEALFREYRIAHSLIRERAIYNKREYRISKHNRYGRVWTRENAPVILRVVQ